MPPSPKTTPTHDLRIPQARVLKALAPPDGQPEWAWPTLPRFELAEAAGFVPTTGTINRVLNGVPPGSSSGASHPGLLELGLIKKTALVLDGGIVEANYQITAAGIAALKRFLAKHKGVVPKARTKESCINSRYVPPTPTA